MLTKRRQDPGVPLFIRGDGMVSYGRRPKGRPRAFVFAWAATEQEAEDKAVLHCRLGYKGGYFVTPTWGNQDIDLALKTMRQRFGVEETSHD